MEIESTRIFVKVVQQGSFSKAAQLLRMPVSTVSRAVSRLEGEVGARLLQRTTRALKLTSAGLAFYESCLGPIQLIEDARRSLQGADSMATGTIRITASEDFGAHAVTPAIAGLMKQHPALSFEFDYTDAVIDLVAEGYDLAVRIGKLPPSRLKAIRLGHVSIIAVASPAYLAAKPRIREPKDLHAHDLISFAPDAGGARITLSSGKRSVTVARPLRASGNQMGSLVRLAEAGVGVAFVPHFACLKALSSGKLERVLPEWTTEDFPVSLVSVATGPMPARVRLVADRLAASLRAVLRYPVTL
jgi:DNA-binding transcriptional LysR family regulator